MYTRRGLLGWIAGGVLASGSGCAEAGSGGVETDAPGTRTTTEGSAELTRSATASGRSLPIGETVSGPDGTDVTLSAVRIWKIIYSADVETRVNAAPRGDVDAHFLVVDVSTAGGEDASSLPLAVWLDGEVVADDAYRLGRDPEADRALAFLVPVGTVSTGAIEWRPSADVRYRWTLPDYLLSDLGRSPSFEVRRFDVPDTIGRGDRFEATIEVANTGDRGDRFLAEVTDQGGSSVPLVSRFTMDVPTGVSFTRELSGRIVEGDRSGVTAVLDWGIDRRETSFSLS